MSRRGSGVAKLLVGFAALLLLIIVVGLATSMERVERTVRIPPAPEARRNPLLAAERFLEAMGMQSEGQAQLDELPPVDRMLVLGMPDRLLTRTQADELLGWVAGGGYLVVGPHLQDGVSTRATQNDRLLDRLGVSVETIDDSVGNAREALELEVIEGEGALEVEFYSAIALSVDDDGDAQSYAFVWDDYGAGRYVVVNDVDFMRFDRIGELDHAAFLWQVARFGGAREQALLIHGMQQASIWALLGRFAWPSLIAGSLLLLAMAWRRATRFGPMLPRRAAGSRSLIDHVDGLGWFLWKRRRADALIDAAREALLQRIALCRPDFARSDRQTQLKMLTVGSGVTPAKVEAAVFGGRSPRKDEYTKTIRTLERLRRKL